MCSKGSKTCPKSCKDSSPVIPTTPLITFLERLQETAFKIHTQQTEFDPKAYVDLSLKKDLCVTVEAFEKLPRTENGSVTVKEFNSFVEEYLNSDADEGLMHVKPEDFVAEPEEFLLKVENMEVREWALEVHSLWKNLSRKVSDRVFERTDFYTLLPLRNPLVVPGSRFREVYYWDSYWVMRGLLASKMYDTARGIIYNLISLVEEYGYVPNGARAYYTNRSQPPLLSSMVMDVYNRTRDYKLVLKSLPALLKEHEFWNSGMHKVMIQDAEGSSHTLCRYYAMWDKPRPESSNIMELDISSLARITGNAITAARFRDSAEARKKAINSILWNAEMGQWLDYWLSDSLYIESKDVYIWNASYQNKKVLASNFIPLWIQSFNSDVKTVDEVVQSLQSSGLIYPAGIATSLTKSGQQWDFPNGWAPLQHMIVEGLVRSGSKEAKVVAEDIAVKWMTTNYVAFKRTGTMHEKYDVQKCGDFGGGGEYAPQTGFGWSNGVVLAFLEEFGWPEQRKLDFS
ncbi:trehalase-like isoform X3 [Primulina huaijiensis]|uniref:trehalase-like isoform X3 n=1 Tax=Primulina huaijiensis TaxID=1492673 RepID=UPI003CC6DDFC